MKIKHWSGYGCVDARVVIKGNFYKTIRITGNHEMGLDRPFHDEICMARWLKRFIPKGMKMSDYSTYTDYITVNGLCTESMDITLFFEEDN